MNKRYNISPTIFFVLLVLIPLTSFSEELVEPDNETIKFSKKECREAVRWVNNDLSLLMGSGIIKKIVV